MDEEILNTNFLLYRKKLEDAVCIDLTDMFNEIGENIKKSTFSSIEESGVAFEGALIIMSLKRISKYAFKINEMLPETLKVDVKSLIKVCLLQHISKAFMFSKCKEDWKIKKGMIYEFTPTTNALKGGMKSLIIALKYNIPFNEDEIEAMTCLDRNNKKKKYYSSMLSLIVRQANELASYTSRKNYLIEKQKH